MTTDEDPTFDLKERARDLRRQGLSVAQIAAVLGHPGTSTVQDWVRVVPPPPWTRRPRAKDAERARARDLRVQGLTYDDIVRELHVSKSSVSLWTRDLPHPQRSPEEIDARLAGLRRYFEVRRARVADERSAEKQRWANTIGVLSERELLIAGTVAYWAEGTKSKPWRPCERVVFVNSDADMIRFFQSFLTLLGVEPERLRLQIALHQSADVAAAERFWSEVVNVPVCDFLKTTLKRHAVRTNRKNVGDDYHGCLSIRVLQSALLYRRIEGMWWAICSGRPTSLQESSRVV
jgi:transcriptional regulator with XRE-family HTH domain